jgi:primosomal protein N' (replication factor Y)
MRRLRPGIRVLVPFGNRKIVGVLVKTSDKTDVAPKKLRAIVDIIDDEPLFETALLTSLLWAADYYQHPIGAVFSAALPASLRQNTPLYPIFDSWQITESGMAIEPSSLGRAYKQISLLELLRDKQPLTTAQCKSAGFGIQLLNQLVDKNLVKKVQLQSEKLTAFEFKQKINTNKLKANAEQKSAIKKITNALDQFRCFLLDGITGSGKTEVYMQVIEKQLRVGKQTLILVPEIGLTPQTINRFKSRFDCAVVAIHSDLTNTEKLNSWRAARSGAAGIVIGTRSAVFTPLENPGLIVVDEEHDTSFKQQDGFRYSARDLAVMRAREENICIVLGSATPCLESLQNALSGKFSHLKLLNRAGNAQSPTLRLIDVSNEYTESGYSEQLLTRIHQHLNNGNQVLVFINRRGFAPVLKCDNCGWLSECGHCDTQLTVHKSPLSLKCHHCGSSGPIPDFCPSCRSKQLVTLGMGTQKSEQFLSRQFPDYPVVRIDRDSTRSKSRLNSLLKTIETGAPSILIGTQILAKGHHFPNITLVAILDADYGLFSADFRGQENMAQILLQVAGRAGRADRAGEVLIQTRHSTHSMLQTLVKCSYQDIAENLLQERKAAEMPPFSHLALIRCESQDIKLAISTINQIASLLRSMTQTLKGEVQMQGPMPAPMEKRAGRYRMHLHLHTRSRPSLSILLNQACQQIQGLKMSRKVRWSVDVDPSDLI